MLRYKSMGLRNLLLQIIFRQENFQWRTPLVTKIARHTIVVKVLNFLGVVRGGSWGIYSLVLKEPTYQFSVSYCAWSGNLIFVFNSNPHEGSIHQHFRGHAPSSNVQVLFVVEVILIVEVHLNISGHLPSIEGRLPLKVVFHQRSSSTNALFH